MRKILIILIICATVVIAFLIVRWVCYNVFILPKWIPKDITKVNYMVLSTARYGGGLKTIEIHDSVAVEALYNLISETRITRLFFGAGHSTSDHTDAPFFIEIYFQEGDSRRYMIGGVRNGGNLIKDQGESDVYWSYGKENSGLEAYVASFFKAE